MRSYRVRRKRRGRFPDLGHPPENRQFWRPLVKRLLAVRACCEKFLGRSMRNDGCALATSADTVKASFSQSLGPSQGDVQVSSTTIYTATWLENGNSNTGRLKQKSSSTATRTKKLEDSHALTYSAFARTPSFIMIKLINASLSPFPFLHALLSSSIHKTILRKLSAQRV